jgi:hypothetical protein
MDCLIHLILWLGFILNQILDYEKFPYICVRFHIHGHIVVRYAKKIVHNVWRKKTQETEEVKDLIKFQKSLTKDRLHIEESFDGLVPKKDWALTLRVNLPHPIFI